MPGIDNTGKDSGIGTQLLPGPDVASTVKTCFACKETKSVGAFYIDRRKGDGLTPRCKKCTSEARAWKVCSRCERSKPDYLGNFCKDDDVCKVCRGELGNKRCTLCRLVQPKAEFYRKGPTWYSRCKTCSDEQHKVSNRRNRLRREFGLSLEDHEAMLWHQDNVCAICKQPETKRQLGKLMSLHVDHSHSTGRVRGLLCADCNLGIGRFKDEPHLLREAAVYLERSTDAPQHQRTNPY